MQEVLFPVGRSIFMQSPNTGKQNKKQNQNKKYCHMQIIL